MQRPFLLILSLFLTRCYASTWTICDLNLHPDVFSGNFYIAECREFENRGFSVSRLRPIHHDSPVKTCVWFLADAGPDEPVNIERFVLGWYGMLFSGTGLSFYVVHQRGTMQTNSTSNGHKNADLSLLQASTDLADFMAELSTTNQCRHFLHAFGQGAYWAHQTALLLKDRKIALAGIVLDSAWPFKNRPIYALPKKSIGILAKSLVDECATDSRCPSTRQILLQGAHRLITTPTTDTKETCEQVLLMESGAPSLPALLGTLVRAPSMYAFQWGSFHAIDLRVLIVQLLTHLGTNCHPSDHSQWTAIKTIVVLCYRAAITDDSSIKCMFPEITALPDYTEAEEEQAGPVNAERALLEHLIDFSQNNNVTPTEDAEHKLIPFASLPADIPVFLIYGKWDWVIPPTAIIQLMSELQTSRDVYYVRVPYCGNLPSMMQYCPARIYLTQLLTQFYTTPSITMLTTNNDNSNNNTSSPSNVTNSNQPVIFRYANFEEEFPFYGRLEWHQGDMGERRMLWPVSHLSRPVRLYYTWYRRYKVMVWMFGILMLVLIALITWQLIKWRAQTTKANHVIRKNQSNGHIL